MIERKGNWLTYEKVAFVAEMLISRGETPTMIRVRQELGNTGSNSTINKYLNEWKTAKLRGDSVKCSLGAPDSINSAVNKVLQQINEEAQAEITAEKAKVEGEMASMRVEKDNLLQERAQLLQGLELLRQNLSEFKTENINLKDQIKRSETKIQVSSATFLEAERRHVELMQEKEKQINELHGSHAKGIQLLKDQMEELNKSQKRELDELRTLMETQRHDWLNEKDALKVESKKLEKELQKQEMTAQSYKEKLSESTQQSKTKELQLQEMVLENQQLKAKVAQLDRSNSGLETELSILKSQLEEQKTEQGRTLQKLQQEREALIRLEERLQQALNIQSGKKKKGG